MSIATSRRSRHLVEAVLVSFLLGAVPSVADTFIVDTLADSGSGSFREALQNANDSNGPDVILFDAGLEGRIEVTSVLPNASGNLEIIGPGADRLTIDGGTSGHGTLRFFFGNSVTLQGFTLRHGTDFQGGAIYFASGHLTLVEMRLVDHQAIDVGGAVFLESGTSAELVDTEIGRSRSGSGGGGIYADFGATLDVVRSTIHSNETFSDGGGIYATVGSVVTISDSTIANNSAAFGGGLWVDDALTLEHVTIANNSASSAGGVRAGSSTTVAGTIISGNEGGDCEAGLGVLDRSNLSSDFTCGFNGPSDLRGVDAELLPLLRAGGPTATMVPMSGSPVIDRGDTSACAAVDQRGRARSVDGDGDGTGRCDIGAVEFEPGFDELWVVHADDFESGDFSGWAVTVSS